MTKLYPFDIPLKVYFIDTSQHNGCMLSGIDKEDLNKNKNSILEEVLVLVSPTGRWPKNTSTRFEMKDEMMRQRRSGL